MTDVPSTYGALLLGALFAAGYVATHPPIHLAILMLNTLIAKAIWHSNRAGIPIHQTLPLGYVTHKDHGKQQYCNLSCRNPSDICM